MKHYTLTPILLAFTFVIASLNIYSQQDNPLPPGPARINGKVIFENKPLPDIDVILLYERDDVAHKQVFKTNKEGYFTVYVYNGIENPLVCVAIENKVQYTYIPEYVSEGINSFKDFIIDSNQKIKIKNKKYRKLLRN